MERVMEYGQYWADLNYLGWLRDPGSKPVFLRLLESSHPGPVAGAIDALALLGASDAFPKALAACERVVPPGPARLQVGNSLLDLAAGNRNLENRVRRFVGDDAAFNRLLEHRPLLLRR